MRDQRTALSADRSVAFVRNVGAVLFHLAGVEHGNRTAWECTVGQVQGSTNGQEVAVDFGSLSNQKRREQRIRMVLPLRVSARDASDAQFEELAHTLDIAPHGARLGAIRHQLKIGTAMVVQYRQHRLHCRVAWMRLLEGTKEYQVGVELLENGRDTWGLDLNAVNTVEEPEAELVMA